MTGSNSLAGVPDACAVTAWQAAVQAGGAARSRMASKSFTRLRILEHFVDVPVPQITDELLNEVDVAVRGSGGGRWEGEEAKAAAARGAVLVQTQLLGTMGSTPIQR